MNERLTTKDFLSLEFIVLFLCAIEFLSKFYSIVLLLFFVLVIKGRIKKDAFNNKNFWRVLLFCLTYLIVAYQDLPLVIIPVWLLSYVIGYSLTNNSKSFFSMWLIIASGIAIHSLLILFFNVNTFGQDAMGNRIMYDIWGNNLWRGATALACSFLLGSSLVIPLFLSKQRTFGAIVFFVFILYGVFFNAILTASRSSLIYPVIILVVSLMPLLKERKNVRIVFPILLFVLILSIIYFGNIFGFRTFFENQYLFERFVEKDGGGVVENQRIDIWSEMFKDFYKYFWAGGKFGNEYEQHFVHNILLDTYVTGGIFPSLLLLFLLIGFIKSIWKLYIESNVLFTRSLLLGLCFGFLLIFISEPIIQAANWFFSYFLMLIGCLDKINHQKYLGKWH